MELNNNIHVEKMQEFLEEEKKKSKFRLPLNLQFFAGEGDDTGAGGDDDGGSDDSSSDDDSAGSDDGGTDDGGTDDDQSGDDDSKKKRNNFTQEDVSNIAAKEAKKAREKILKQLGVKDVKSASEALKEFNKQKDANKTEQQKMADRAKALEEENNGLLSKTQELEAKVSAMTKGVKSDSLDDVIALAGKYVDDDTDMDAAIDKVVEKYPHFKAESTTDADDKKKKKKPKFSDGDHDASAGKQTDGDKWTQAFKWN